jgi:hypothetical protein
MAVCDKSPVHLCKEVVLWVLVQGCDGACRAKPGVDAADALLPQHAVVRGKDVCCKSRDLLKQLVLGQVQQLGALLLLLLLALLLLLLNYRLIALLLLALLLLLLLPRHICRAHGRDEFTKGHQARAPALL